MQRELARCQYYRAAGEICSGAVICCCCQYWRRGDIQLAPGTMPYPGRQSRSDLLGRSTAEKSVKSTEFRKKRPAYGHCSLLGQMFSWNLKSTPCQKKAAIDVQNMACLECIYFLLQNVKSDADMNKMIQSFNLALS